jgi:hypothetical protein
LFEFFTLIYSIFQPAFFAVRHFSHRDPKYGKALEVIQLPPPLKALPNSTKCQSIQDEEFQRFCDEN